MGAKGLAFSSTRGVWAVWLGPLAALLCAGALAGCSSDDQPAVQLDRDALYTGATLYDDMCAVCHGQAGQGVSAPALAGWERSRDELINIIETRMPPGSPGQCKGSCSQDVAAYILSGFAATQPVCAPAASPLPPRRLRLLTRREFASTLAALAPPQQAPCVATVFSYDPKGRSLNSVHVAGSFNNWPQTIAGGGWAMAYDGASHLYKLQKALDPGTYSYKFVLNESEWITDPSNPSTTPDGFGGQNSVLTVTCKAGSPPAALDYAANLPDDARPDGFPFDDAADARVVTTLHIEGYRQAAQLLAKQATDNLSTFLPCDPSGGKATSCAEQFVRTFGRRAFRRPLAEDEVARYKALLLFQPVFADGVSAAVQALLLSPYFQYRFELGTAQPDGTFRLSPFEVATALSYQLWGTTPDDALLDAAEHGGLDTPDGIEAQARRLLADPRSREALSALALSWLGVEGLATTSKSPTQFPSFTPDLTAALLAETGRFAAHVVFDSSHQLEELFTANYSFVNDALAKLYALPPVTGGELVQTSYGAVGRSGVLGHGSVLASYAHSDQTSPILRGLFVRRRLLCQELPPPPPNAGAVPAVDPNATTRERFRQHQSAPFCKTCHQYIDDVGMGFEGFDPIGQPRSQEGGQPIDPSGDMNDLPGLGAGTHAAYTTQPQLGQLLAGSPRAASCFVRQYVRYARGAHEDLVQDACVLWRLQGRFRDSGHNILELMVAVTREPGFTARSAELVPSSPGSP